MRNAENALNVTLALLAAGAIATVIWGAVIIAKSRLERYRRRPAPKAQAEPPTPQKGKPGPAKAMLVIALALLAMFWRLLDPDLTLASNDAPLGSIVHYWPVDNMSGNWNDLNWLGAAAPYGTPSLWMSLEYVTSSPVALVLAIIAWRAFMSVWLWAGGLCFPKFERWRARVLAACATGGCLAVGYALKIGLQTQTLGQAALIVGLPALVVIVLTVFHIKKRIGHA